MTTRIISFVSQKGGVGKTTTSIIAATNFKYHFNKDVVILDIDVRQSSSSVLRRKNISYCNDQSLIDNAYPIVEVNYDNIYDKINEYYGKVDYIIVDFPGTMSAEMAKGLFYIEYMFIPFSYDELEIEATKVFYNSIIKHYYNNEKALCKDVRLFFCKYTEAASKTYKGMREVFEGNGINMLENVVKDLKIYPNKYRDTLIPIPDSKENYGKGIKKILKEIVNILDDGKE